MEVEPSQQSGVLENSDVQRTLLVAYSKIGEPDSLYGACSANATEEITRIHLYEHEKEWAKSLSECRVCNRGNVKTTCGRSRKTKVA